MFYFCPSVNVNIHILYVVICKVFVYNLLDVVSVKVLFI
jgi:hypothetical protein